MSSDEMGLYVRAQRFVTRITQGASQRCTPHIGLNMLKYSKTSNF